VCHADGGEYYGHSTGAYPNPKSILRRICEKKLNRVIVLGFWITYTHRILGSVEISRTKKLYREVHRGFKLSSI